MVVEALEPRHDPPAVGLEEDELRAGEPLAHTARGQIRDAAHHVDRIRDRLREEHARTKVRVGLLRVLLAELGRRTVGVEVVLVAAVGIARAVESEPDARAGQVGRQERVQRDRQTGVLRRLPDRVVDRVVERSPVDRRVRAHEHRDHAGQLGNAADLRRDARDVVGLVHRGHRARAEQATFTLLGVRGAPVVVRACLCLGEVDVVQTLEPEQHRGIEHREVDAVGVHVLETRLGVVRRRPHLGVPQFAAERLLAVLVAHARGTGGRHEVRGEDGAVVVQPLDALLVGLDVPDAVAVLRRRVVEHARGVLENVAVGVDVAQSLCGGHGHSPVVTAVDVKVTPRVRAGPPPGIVLRGFRPGGTVRNQCLRRQSAPAIGSARCGTSRARSQW